MAPSCKPFLLRNPFGCQRVPQDYSETRLPAKTQHFAGAIYPQTYRSGTQRKGVRHRGRLSASRRCPPMLQAASSTTLTSLVQYFMHRNGQTAYALDRHRSAHGAARKTAGLQRSRSSNSSTTSMSAGSQATSRRWAASSQAMSSWTRSSITPSTMRHTKHVICR